MIQRPLPDTQLSTTSLNPANLETLDQLFTTVSAEELREDLLELYHSYLVYCHGNLPVTFGRISRNMYRLSHCLAEMERRGS
jgi:hypothetical protein